jgi:hypothetical protein
MNLAVQLGRCISELINSISVVLILGRQRLMFSHKVDYSNIQSLRGGIMQVINCLLNVQLL